MKRKVGVVGMGYWGPKVARCFKELDSLWAICDEDEERLYKANETLEVGNLAGDFTALLSLGCDAVAIVTPPETHYDLAREALNEGMDVFIEKPMATMSDDAEALEKQAKAQGRNLFVGHIYLHNSGLMAIPRPVGTAELHIVLLNKGGGPSDRDPFWAALPHAVSLAWHFFPDKPSSVWAERKGHRYQVVLRYFNHSTVYIDVGDHAGVKRRGIEMRDGRFTYNFDVDVPNVTSVDRDHSWTYEKVEPLLAECQAFLKYEGIDPIGAKVVRTMEQIRDACSKVEAD